MIYTDETAVGNLAMADAMVNNNTPISVINKYFTQINVGGVNNIMTMLLNKKDGRYAILKNNIHNTNSSVLNSMVNI
ncbi:MAG: hypothetical protein R8M45_03920 [Ghiorsea sp.]